MIGVKNTAGGGGKQFTPNQVIRILALIYQNATSTIALSVSNIERGVVTSLAITYSLISNDDLFTAATITGIGNVLPKLNAGPQTTVLGNYGNNAAFTLAMNYTRNGIATVETKTVNFVTVLPQWAGVSANSDYASYVAIAADVNLIKVIQASAAITKVISPASQYIWFISNKNNATIQDGNGFSMTIGGWNDGVSEFYLKPITITLLDGVNMALIYLYRSRQVKTFTGLTYKIL
jgi:hypothetical protein